MECRFVIFYFIACKSFNSFMGDTGKNITEKAQRLEASEEEFVNQISANLNVNLRLLCGETPEATY